MGRPYTSSEVAWEYFMRGAELYRRYTPQDNATCAGRSSRKLLTWTRSLQGRMRVWLPPIGKIDHGRWTQDPAIFRGPGLSHGAKGG